MKGVVFTELLDFPANRDGNDLVEAVPLASGAACTAVGTCDHEERAVLCGALAERPRQRGVDLVRALFGPQAAAAHDSLPTLAAVADTAHRESLTDVSGADS